MAKHRNTLKHTATRYKTLLLPSPALPPHPILECTLQPIATHCNTPQHTTTHCNKLQHTSAAATPTGPLQPSPPRTTHIDPTTEAHATQAATAVTLATTTDAHATAAASSSSKSHPCVATHCNTHCNT